MLSWFRLIDDADSSAELLVVARDYLATWEPQELARLPASCRPGRIKTEKDIEELHATLVEEYRDTTVGGEDLALLQKMTSFMVRAAVRLAQLRGDGDDGGDSGGRDDEVQRPSGKRSAARDQ